MVDCGVTNSQVLSLTPFPSCGHFADRNRDGYLTGSELGMFLEETVINLSRSTQTPQYGKLRYRLLNKGDFVFSPLATDSINNSTAKVIKERKIIEQDRSKIKHNCTVIA